MPAEPILQFANQLVLEGKIMKAICTSLQIHSVILNEVKNPGGWRRTPLRHFIGFFAALRMTKVFSGFEDTP
jgi:hypothetical protein